MAFFELSFPSAPPDWNIFPQFISVSKNKKPLQKTKYPLALVSYHLLRFIKSNSSVCDVTKVILVK